MSLNDIIHRQDATAWDRFISSPLIFFARWLYAAPSAASSTSDKLPICLKATFSSTQVTSPSLADYELDDALAWLNSHPHPHNLFIVCNHDVALASPQTLARDASCASMAAHTHQNADRGPSSIPASAQCSPPRPSHILWADDASATFSMLSLIIQVAAVFLPAGQSRVGVSRYYLMAITFYVTL
ncbi:hypothetical protein AX14_011279, partial [Amanita brunnescens Koide BX004]